MGRHGGYGGTRGGDGGEGGKISFAVAALIAFVVLALAGKIDAEGALAKFLSVIKIVGIVGIISVLLLVLTAIGFAWWAAKKEAKRKEDERAQQLLRDLDRVARFASTHRTRSRVVPGHFGNSRPSFVRSRKWSIQNCSVANRIESGVAEVLSSTLI